MIKYETIISNFEDKTTLYNWLRKVEEALKSASATNFVVNKKGNATLSFSITFTDGTTLESGDIVLQQGESVDDARIASGILQLHLTNGTWLTAGNLKPVNNFSINASQHLIVNYQDGTSQDLGAIFSGNVTISGDLTATGAIAGATASITGNASIGGDLTVTGDISGNEITGNSIIENMNGYSYAFYEQEGWVKNPIYAGACKNGNKLTYVIAIELTKITSNATGYPIIAVFFTPSDVMAKLYPFEDILLDVRDVKAIHEVNTDEVAIRAYAQKHQTNVRCVLFESGALDLNKTYYVRYEVTFLLSDNLAQ